MKLLHIFLKVNIVLLSAQTKRKTKGGLEMQKQLHLHILVNHLYFVTINGLNNYIAFCSLTKAGESKQPALVHYTSDTCLHTIKLVLFVVKTK